MFFGFACIHYTVHENQSSLKIKIDNKTKKIAKVGVRTVDGDAKEGLDYLKFDEIIQFKDDTHGSLEQQ